MAKNYVISTGFRTPKPRSKRLQGLGASGESSSTFVGGLGDGGFAAFKSKFEQMFQLVDANGNEVSNVEDAVAVKVVNGLSLYAEGELTAGVASTNP